MNYAKKKIINANREYFTVNSLADILGVDCSTIRKDIKNKHLAAEKIFRCYLILPSDALMYVNKFN